MQQIDLPSLFTYVFITTFTPGPNNITSASMAICFGIKRTINFIYGIVTGFFVVLFLCGNFSNLLIKAIPSIEPIVRYIGAGYILWLAYGILKTNYSIKEKSDSIPKGFLKGFLLQFLNPKGIIYGLTIYTVFLLPIIKQPLYVIISALLFASVAFFSLITWSLFGTIINKYLHHVRIRNMVNVSLGLLLVYTALRLAGLL